MEERGPGGREGTASQGVPHHPEKTETPASLNVTAVFLASQSCFVALVPIYFNYPEIKKKKKKTTLPGSGFMAETRKKKGGDQLAES